MAPRPQQTPLSLPAYMRAKTRAACPVCKLPDAIRAQLGRPAGRRGFSRADQIEWLREACGVQISVEELTAHLSGRHEEGA